jgi:serine/threonine-protein kinase
VLAGLAGLGVALPTLAATEKKSGIEKKCCDVRVGDLRGALTAGGGPASVTATLAARRQGCTSVRPRLVVRLAGLEPDEIRIQRVAAGGSRTLPVSRAGGGAVQAPDVVSGALRLCGDGRANLAYRVTLLDGAPAGRATVTAEADTASGRVLGRDATATVVLDPASAPPDGPAEPGPPAAPPARPPASGVDSPSATGPSAAPAVARRGPTTGGPFSQVAIATSLGGVVAAAVAMVGVLALRQRRREGWSAGPAVAAGWRRQPGARGPHDPGHLARQPTLADRWSSLVATMRRSPPVDSPADGRS